MRKAILQLTGIEYSGESIGDDIRIEIEALGTLLAFNKQLTSKESIILDKEIGQAFIDQSTLNISVGMRIIERDLVFNDVGSKNISIRINPKGNQYEKSKHLVKVRESRGTSNTKEAHFYVGLELIVIESDHYIKETDQGWVIVVLDESSKKISLPSYLRIQLNSTKSGRNYFTIMEGPFQGKTGSVKLDENGSSFIAEGNPYNSPIRMKYSISKKTLTVKEETYKTIDYEEKPWQKGLYDIELPDVPHKGGQNYLTASSKAFVWFRVGHTGERYIHIGRRTLGCITLTEHDRWNGLYDLLIKARKGDSTSIGTLEIID
jgi:hypothetical protein